MARKKNFLLLSMEDEKIKKVSNVISNESCRKILDYLSDKDATQSELAEKLNIPISTVHYNIQQLTETGLIESTEFHYSKKGKEVNYYRLADKYIIIAPKKAFGIKEKLKSILPVALIASATTLILQFFYKYFLQAPQPIQAESLAAQSAAESVAYEGRSLYNDNLPQGIWNTIADGLNDFTGEKLVWMLTGVLLTLLVCFVAKLINKGAKK